MFFQPGGRWCDHTPWSFPQRLSYDQIMPQLQQSNFHSNLSNTIQLDVPHSKSFFDWTVTLGQYAIENFMKNSIFLFSIFTWEPFFIWDKPLKVFLGSNAHIFESGSDFFWAKCNLQLIVHFLWKKKYTSLVIKWPFDPKTQIARFTTKNMFRV